MSMLSRLTFSTLFFAIFLIGQTAWATTYYVDDLLPGSNNNKGTTEATPFLTINKCVQTATNPGDTCLIKNGTYTTEGLITITKGGSLGNPITYKNYPGHKPKIQWSDNTNFNNRILIAPGTSVCKSSPPGYWVIEGLEISNGYNGIKVDCGHNLIIRKNHIHDTWYAAILIPSGFKITIDRNHIHHTGDFTGAPNPDTGLPHTHGIYLTGKEYVITNNLIYDTYLSGMHLAGYPLGTRAAPNEDYAGFSGLVANNTVAYAITSAGIIVWQVNAVNTTIENNILYENCNNDTCSASGIQFLNVGNGHVVRNNIHYATGGGTSNFIGGNATQGVQYTQTNNCPATIGSSCATNPNMVNAPATLPATPDFSLTSGSRAIDYGLDLRSVGVTSDFKGLLRPQGAAFDVGAHEFSGDTETPAAPRGLEVR